MMSRDIIKKHKNVMLWFIANPEKDVWGRDDNSDNWTLTDTPVFSLGSTFVQNDEYAEFRKAEADGKVVEVRTLSGDFEPASKNLSWYDPVGDYRIKSDEPN